MAKGLKTGGRDFVKGQTGCGGRHKLPEDLKGIKRITPEYFERLITLLLDKPMSEIESLAKSQEVESKFALVAGLMVHALKHGDPQRLEFLLNRTVGKVSDKLEVKQAKPFVIRRRNGEQVILGIKDGQDEDNLPH